MATVVTNTYHCEWRYVTDEYYQDWLDKGKYDDLADYIVDAEDDIITAAVHQYNMERMEGDDKDVRLRVFYRKATDHDLAGYVILDDQDWDKTLEYICDVYVEVRSSTVRF